MTKASRQEDVSRKRSSTITKAHPQYPRGLSITTRACKQSPVMKLRSRPRQSENVETKRTPSLPKHASKLNKHQLQQASTINKHRVQQASASTITKFNMHQPQRASTPTSTNFNKHQLQPEPTSTSINCNRYIFNNQPQQGSTSTTPGLDEPRRV